MISPGVTGYLEFLGLASVMAITSGTVLLLDIRFTSSSNLLWRLSALVYHIVSLSFRVVELEDPLVPVWGVPLVLLLSFVVLHLLSPGL